ncbi:hypothetical protein ONZ45_g1419 [Pleurotus djamor]|nr:hypothetical protein ONZ45_g1419 [Pleurotus djamor]
MWSPYSTHHILSLASNKPLSFLYTRAAGLSKTHSRASSRKFNLSSSVSHTALNSVTADPPDRLKPPHRSSVYYPGFQLNDPPAKFKPPCSSLVYYPGFQLNIPAVATSGDITTPSNLSNPHAGYPAISSLRANVARPPRSNLEAVPQLSIGPPLLLTNAPRDYLARLDAAQPGTPEAHRDILAYAQPRFLEMAVQPFYLGLVSTTGLRLGLRLVTLLVQCLREGALNSTPAAFDLLKAAWLTPWFASSTLHTQKESAICHRLVQQHRGLYGTVLPTPGAVTWRLAVPDQHTRTLPTHGDVFFESARASDERRCVPSSDYQDGGPYRSIAKLQMFCDNGLGFSVGTGWLLNEDTLVTAGHNVYQWLQTTNYPKEVAFPCTVLDCFIGFEGPQSVTTPGSGVQHRSGQLIVIPERWTYSSGQSWYDWAIIRLDRPFNGHLNIIPYIDTPPSGTATLGVVGYPTDKEHGTRMHDAYERTTYDLDADPHLLLYQISTAKGQSGSPILMEVEDGLVVVGTHSGESVRDKSNAGVPIGGRWGIPYATYLDILNGPENFATDPNRLEVVSLAPTFPP